MPDPREPRPLTDEIGEPETGGDRPRIQGRRRFPVDEPFFEGHFPGMPVVPGVFMVEALAACAARLLAGLPEAQARPGRPPGLRAISSVRFRRRVGPGDLLDLEAVLVGRDGAVFHIAAEARVGSHRAVEATLEFG